jgi:hypothetical protein
MAPRRVFLLVLGAAAVSAQVPNTPVTYQMNKSTIIMRACAPRRAAVAAAAAASAAAQQQRGGSHLTAAATVLAAPPVFLQPVITLAIPTRNRRSAGASSTLTVCVGARPSCVPPSRFAAADCSAAPN